MSVARIEYALVRIRLYVQDSPVVAKPNIYEKTAVASDDWSGVVGCAGVQGRGG